MAEAEIPEDAKNPFEKRVAMTIAIIAVCMALNENHNDNAKTDAILLSIEASQKTTEAANKWSYFQSKSIKGHSYDIERDLLPTLADGSVVPEKRDKLMAAYAKKVEKYEAEKATIKAEAEALEHESKGLRDEAKKQVEINQRCDHAALALQIAVVLCSVAILVHFTAFWYVGMALAAVGAVIAGSAFIMPEGTSGTKEAEQAMSEPVKPATAAAHH